MDFFSICYVLATLCRWLASDENGAGGGGDQRPENWLRNRRTAFNRFNSCFNSFNSCVNQCQQVFVPELNASLQLEWPLNKSFLIASKKNEIVWPARYYAFIYFFAKLDMTVVASCRPKKDFSFFARYVAKHSILRALQIYWFCITIKWVREFKDLITSCEYWRIYTYIQQDHQLENFETPSLRQITQTSAWYISRNCSSFSFSGKVCLATTIWNFRTKVKKSAKTVCAWMMENVALIKWIRATIIQVKHFTITVSIIIIFINLLSSKVLCKFIIISNRTLHFVSHELAKNWLTLL